jgi:hypothetical protein
MLEVDWLSSTDPVAMLKWAASDGSGPGEGPNRHRVSDRRLRLFAVACCRQVWDSLTDERSRTAIEMAERLADGEVTEADARKAEFAARRACADLFGNFESEMAWKCASTIQTLVENAGLPRWFSVSTKLAALQAALLRDICNPFRTVPFVIRIRDGKGWMTNAHGQPGSNQWERCPWLTSTVQGIARQCYDERNFSGLPILADALEDAGCGDEEILRHLRRPAVCPKCKGTRKTFIADPNDAFAAGDVGCWECEKDGAGPHVRGCHVVDTLLGLS